MKKNDSIDKSLLATLLTAFLGIILIILFVIIYK